ncbi:YciI family protein [Luedemannella flava]|uniref:YciI family protein n=1 Tax=Luedemannella flava TaxID=349316 RepID=A0ABN2M2P7_9ACTN
MKYMIMMFGDAGTMMEEKSKEWITEMIQFMTDLDKELAANGEFVFGEGLADSVQAKTMTMVDGTPVVTDGPFAESKESLIGFWVVDVADEQRVLEIAGRIVAYSGKLEIRPIPGGPPEL